MSQSFQASRTDLRIVLDNIDVLLCQMRSSVNVVSRQLLAMAAAVECVTLSQKLRVTLQRWQVYLPFHECRDVNFKHWVRHLATIRKTLDSCQYYPNHSFCLDLLDFDAAEDGDETVADSLPVFAPRYGESELQTDVREYVSRVDEQMNSLAQLSEDEEQEWRTNINKQAMSVLHKQYADHLYMVSRYDKSRHLVETEVLPKVRNYLNAVVGQPVMDYCLDMALDTLLYILRQMDQMFSADKSNQQFLRLSFRLYYRHCPDALQEANSIVHRWAAEWPRRGRKQRAIEKRDQLIEGLRQQYGTLGIADYIEIYRPEPLADPEFGHFLFASRHKLEIEHVKSLFQDCFLIQELNQLIDPAGAEADISVSRLDQNRKHIFQRLVELIRRAEWQGGMTSEHVQQCLARLLLKSAPSTKEGQTDIDKIFWRLLTNRRNCEEEFRSLKLTWLNLVGYFRSRGFLKGGSLTLCRYFFPNDERNDDDHNAVNKGAGDRAGNDFHDLIQALDDMLKKTPPF